MYPIKHVRYLNLPKVPNEIVSQISTNIAQYKEQGIVKASGDYVWSDLFNKEIDQWGKSNICADMYYAFQMMNSNLPMHKDVGTKTKLIYALETGGKQVFTEFYDEDQNTLLESIQIEPYRWHLLKADSYHCVVGIEPGHVRFSICAQVFR